MAPGRHALLALVLLVAAAACHDHVASSAAAASSATVPIGASASGTGYDMSVRSVRRCPADVLHPASSNHHWVGVDVVLRGTAVRHVPANPFYATLVDDRGNHYRSQPGPCVPPLRHTPLAAGDSAHGWLSFLVADSADNLELDYAPRLPGKEAEKLVFKLGS